MAAPYYYHAVSALRYYYYCLTHQLTNPLPLLSRYTGLLAHLKTFELGGVEAGLTATKLRACEIEDANLSDFAARRHWCYLASRARAVRGKDIETGELEPKFVESDHLKRLGVIERWVQLRR